MKKILFAAVFFFSVFTQAAISGYSCTTKSRSFEIILNDTSMDLSDENNTQIGSGTKLYGTEDYRFYSPLKFGVIFPNPLAKLIVRDGETYFHLTNEYDSDPVQLEFPCKKVVACGDTGAIRVKFSSTAKETASVYYWNNRFDDGLPPEYVEFALTKDNSRSYRSDNATFFWDGTAGSLLLVGNGHSQTYSCQ
jgi:hypothetical protein